MYVVYLVTLAYPHSDHYWHSFSHTRTWKREEKLCERDKKHELRERKRSREGSLCVYNNKIYKKNQNYKYLDQ